MAIVSVANLVLSFGQRRILDGVNLTLDAGQHVGMVGRNGCGKSTLLKLMAGLENLKPESGQVQVARGATVGYLRQDPELDPNATLREEAQQAFAHLEQLHRELEEVAHAMAHVQGEALEKLMAKYEQLEHRMQAAGGYAVDHQVEQVLHGVGLTDEFFPVRVKDLSGGQRGRLALAKLLLAQPDVLLLDEPTNHLDIAGRQWLEAFLAEYSGAVLLVSHDRWLLDRAVDRIIEMHQGKMEEYPGNYQQYVEQRALRRLTQAREFQKQQDYVRQQQAFIDRYRAGQRARQAQGRLKRLDRYRADQLIDRPQDQDVIHLMLRPAQRCGDLVVTCENLSKGYDNKPLFEDLELTVKRGQRIGVIGPNGAGKSTLIGCLMGTVEPDAGTVKVGPSVDVGYYRQTHQGLDLSLTVVDYLRQFVMGGTGAVGSEQAARDLAGAFLFSGDSQDKPFSVLSGGERSRAVLAGLMVGGHNLLVLDEPTNHLDIPSAERLEYALTQFTTEPEGFSEKPTGGGTLILITHDRWLLDSLVDCLIILDGQGGVRVFDGTYSDWLEAEAELNRQAAAQAEAAKAKPQPARKPEVRPTPAKTAPAGKPSGNSPYRKWSLEKLEAKVQQIEGEIKAIDLQMMDPKVYQDAAKIKSIQARRNELAQELAPLEEEWLGRSGNG